MKPIFKKFIVIFNLFFIISCSSMGYGLYLWDQTGSNSGNIYKIIDASNIRNSYTVKIDNKKVEIEKWKFEVFKSYKKALEESNQYKEYIHSFAICKKDRHSIRLSNDIFSPQLYSLKDGEVIKIIGRDKNMTQIGSTENYWYKVLTKDGNSGYTYGHNISLYSDNNVTTQDNLLKNFDAIFDKKFYPQEYKSQIENGVININNFEKNYFFIIDKERKEVKIKTDDVYKTYKYSDVTEIAKNSYKLSDTPITIDVETQESIVVTDNSEKNSFCKKFFDIPDFKDIFENEKNLKFEEFKKIVDLSNIFTSDSFGELEIELNRNFRWQDFSKLVPEYLKETTENSGKVNNYLIIPEAMKEQYDGGLTFIFTSGEMLYTTYKFIQDSIQLSVIPKYLVEDNFLKRAPNTPLVIFFKSKNGIY